MAVVLLGKLEGAATRKKEGGKWSARETFRTSTYSFLSFDIAIGIILTALHLQLVSIPISQKH